MNPSEQWPVLVTSGGFAVKIYATKIKGYVSFRVVYYSRGKRCFKTFSRFGTAKSAAEKIARDHADEPVMLVGGPKAAYLRAMEALKPTGVDLDEAAQFFAKRHPSSMPKKTVSEVVTEYVASKESANLSADYIADCKYRCGRFAQKFNGLICDVTGQAVSDFLENIGPNPRGKATELSKAGRKKLGTRSKNNFRLSIISLFNFAKQRKYLPKDWDELDGIQRIKEHAKEITLFTPDEMKALLSFVRPEFLPFIVIGGFAGLRSSEIERLLWSHIHLDTGFIEVFARKGTASRRLVPILPNLRAWIEPLAKDKSGRVVPFDDFGEQIRELCKAASVKWKRNALRHTFISCRVTVTQNVDQVALEAGNSPAKIFSNYRELVKPTQANEWFSITPESIELEKKKIIRHAFEVSKGKKTPVNRGPYTLIKPAVNYNEKPIDET